MRVLHLYEAYPCNVMRVRKVQQMLPICTGDIIFFLKDIDFFEAILRQLLSASCS